MTRVARTRLLSRLRQRIIEALEDRVVWFTHDRLKLTGEPTDDFAVIAIIGREHYEQTRRKYPVRSWSDLRGVIQLEIGDSSDTFALIGPLKGDDREVMFFRLVRGFPTDLVRAAFWVPESLLLADRAKQQGVLTVVREGLEYFIAGNGDTLIAGGAIRTPAVFALAAGLPGDDDPSSLDKTAVLAEFPEALLRLKAADWWMLRSRPAMQRMYLFLKPAAALASVVLIAYLSLVSGFLYGMELLRERQLQALGPEVTSLIAQQRAVDILAQEQDGLIETVKNGQPAWPIWEAVAAVWRTGGGVFALNVSDDEISIRCAAPSATEVLKVLQTLKGFENAQLDSAVRQGMMGQEFVVVLKRTAPGSSRP